MEEKCIQISFLEEFEKTETDQVKNEVEENEKVEDFFEVVVPYAVGDKVRIQMTVNGEEDPETYYYLKDFENKRGVVLVVIHNPRLQYRVLIAQQEVAVYHEELTI